MFDVKAFLEKYNIEFKAYGTHTTSGWIEIHCPFRDCSDPSYHMGIHIKSGVFHCWVCKRKGGAAMLVSTLLKTSFHNANKIINEFADSIIINPEEPPKPAYLKPPKGIGPPNDLVSAYLSSRNFNPPEIINKYHLMYGLPHGDFHYRIIIPVIQNNEVVNYLGRDITGKQSRYKNYPNEKVVVPIKQCMYNIDNIYSDKIIIVEGVFDVWRLGDNAVATLGTGFTIPQIRTLMFKPIREVYIMYDKEADGHAEALAHLISPLVEKVEVVTLEKVKDPAELNHAESMEVKKKLGIL
jgi:DNA primase